MNIKDLVPGKIYLDTYPNPPEEVVFSRISGTGHAVFHPPGEPDMQSSFAVEADELGRYIREKGDGS